MGKASRKKQATRESPKEKRKRKNKLAKILRKQFWPFTLSLAGLIATTIGGNMLNIISSFWGYILFISSLCIFFGYWVLSLCRKLHAVWQITVTSITILIIIFTSQWYVGWFIKDNGSIEMPTFVDDSTPISVYYGNRPHPVARTQTTIGELKQNPQTALSIRVGNNSQTIFYVHIEGNKLYVDTTLFAGIENPNKYIFTAPVIIKNNAFSRTPDGWNIYQNNTNLEIVNQDGIPVLLMEYKSPYKIIIAGLFATPMGICKVNNNEADAIWQLSDNLSGLGTYKVDKVFVHSIFDLFKSERTYILHN